MGLNIDELKKFGDVLQNEPMKNHTTFKIGGNADFMVLPYNTEAMCGLVKYLNSKNEKFIVIGQGSNLLVSDNGIEGVVIKISKAMENMSADGEYIECEAGASLAKLACFALDNSLSGLEFASGIPGSLGGAVYMNAGAYGGEIKDVAESVTFIDNDGEIKKISNNEADFGYRESRFSKVGGYIIKVRIKLNKDDKTKISEKMCELNARRKEKQPLAYPSAGSTFKRPEGYFAAKLIEDSGLKGYQLGGAMVSKKHAGFVINTGNATAKDVIEITDYIKKTVMQKFGVELALEIKKVGRD